MNIRRVLAVVAIPVVISAFGFISLNQTNAANPPSPSDCTQHPPRPDFKGAATKLGVTEAQLKAALGVPANPPNPSDVTQRPPRPDFKGAATKLGVTEQQLIEALGIPPHPQGDRQAPPPADR